MMVAVLNKVDQMVASKGPVDHQLKKEKRMWPICISVVSHRNIDNEIHTFTSMYSNQEF